jgi:transposase
MKRMTLEECRSFLGLWDKTSLLHYPDWTTRAEREGLSMHLTDFARQVPDEVWKLFEPILPPVVWGGYGCPPYDNRECLPAVLYVLVTGMGWRMVPSGLPSYKPGHRRLTLWWALEAFGTAWRPLAQRSEALQGINWEEVWLDGSKKPAKKGARRRAPAPWSAASAGRHGP